jgi:dienelactone hydrolase
MSERITALVFAIAVTICPLVIAGPAPTHANVIYSRAHERCKLDVWLPAGVTSACPLVVYYHGGSFKQGDKSAFRNHRILSKYFGQGIAFASVNYPLLGQGDAGNLILQAARYRDIMAKATVSIKFLKTKAVEWNVDPTRIAVMGISAGAMIAEHLAYWEDLGITGCFAEEQPYRSLFLLSAVKKGHPPLILYTRSGKTDKVHNPDYPRSFKKHFDSVGVKCKLYGSAASGLPSLPHGVSIEEAVMRLFRDQWQTHAGTTRHGKPEATR